MARRPFVSIIIVNYNGKHLLSTCLESVFAIDYPPDQYEIIVVDNSSTDDSVRFIRSRFPKVILVESKVNRGFAGGNIIGYGYATGEYIVLLNTDTKVDPQWLNELIVAAKDPKVGAVNSKLYFATPFLELTVRSSVLPRSEITGNTDFSPLGVLLEDVLCDKTSLNHLIWYEAGFYQKKEGEITLRWTRDKASILIPFEPTGKNNIYKVTVHGYPIDKPIEATMSLSIGSEEVVADTILSHQVKEYMINISPEQASRNYVWLVQNAGNLVLRDGSGKDRGSVVLKQKGESMEFYEKDNETFHRQTHLLAFCGASCLIKREVIDTVGFFDPEYFMYYEDLDLSLRIWMAGWEILYQPTSIVYHKHRATSGGQHDASMLYHLEKNYMTFLLTYFPMKSIAVQSIRLWIRFFYTYTQMKMYDFSDNVPMFEEWRTKYLKRRQALWYILRKSGTLFQRRMKLIKTAKRQFREAKSFQY